MGKKSKTRFGNADLIWLALQEGHCPACGEDSDLDVAQSVVNEVVLFWCGTCGETWELGERPDEEWDEIIEEEIIEEEWEEEDDDDDDDDDDPSDKEKPSIEPDGGPELA